MAEIRELPRRRHPSESCIVTCEAASELARELEPHGVMVIMQSPESGLNVIYNEELGADGAIVMCEAVKAMNVEALLSE